MDAPNAPDALRWRWRDGPDLGEEVRHAIEALVARRVLPEMDG